MNNQNVIQSMRSSYLWFGIAYLFFVVYGSLVPLQYQAHPDAWQAFMQIPYLDLGAESRADWVANILLYIPLSFAGCAVFTRAKHAWLALPVVLACMLLAVSVEFCQQFFPPRTVSQNDLIAESMGSVLGAILWVSWGERISAWCVDLKRGGDLALTAALSLYVCLYLAYSLFPFDFVVSKQELADRLESGMIGWLVAKPLLEGTLRGMVQLTLEVCAVLPLGMLLAHWLRDTRRSVISVALLCGAGLGGVIEFGQVFLNSGIAQGLSVVTRTIGAMMGVLVYTRFLQGKQGMLFVLPRSLTWLVWCSIPVYLFAVVWLQNIRLSDWMDASSALRRLPEVSFLPFFYHYFTTETEALSSLLHTAAAYAPVGILYFMLVRYGASAWFPALLAAALTTVIETCKLFQSQLHPDPTNVGIAAASAAFAFVMMNWLNNLFGQTVVANSPQQNQHRSSEHRSSSEHRGRNRRSSRSSRRHTEEVHASVVASEESVSSPKRKIRSRKRAQGMINPFAVACFIAVLPAIALYPLGGLWLAAGLAGYAWLIQRSPLAWLVLLPMLLPILDFTPWTGRFFFDEFDALILVTFGVVAWRCHQRSLSYKFHDAGGWIWLAFCLSMIGAMIHGGYPFPEWDINSFNNYHSTYNALRVGKGLLWAMLIMHLLRRSLHRYERQVFPRLALGMTLGVLTAALSVIWDRLAFTGLFDFSSDYRAVGMFSATHTGGAYLEAFLIVALPMVVWRVLHARSHLGRALSALILILGCYALMVTYARAAYLALLVAMLVMTVGIIFNRNVITTTSYKAVFATVLLAMLAMAVPILKGDFMRQHFAQAEQAYDVRIKHWRDALGMMPEGGLGTLFGTGLGRYQGLYFLHSSEGIQPANYNLLPEADRVVLSLGSGSPLYFEQMVSVSAKEQYQVSFEVRTHHDTVFSISLCEKWLLYSTNCATELVQMGDTEGKWHPVTIKLNTQNFPERAWYQRPTTKFSILNQSKHAAVDLSRVSLQNQQQQALLKNADFQSGTDHWFFSIDQDLPWHIENLWVQFYFEQGLVGWAIFVVLLLFAGYRIVQLRHHTIFPVAVIAASMAGFLTVGVIDSLFDMPRMTLLFFMLMTWLLLRKSRRSQSGR